MLLYSKRKNVSATECQIRLYNSFAAIVISLRTGEERFRKFTVIGEKDYILSYR